MKDVLAYGEKMKNRKIKVQGEAKDDEDFIFEEFAEDDAKMKAGLGGIDIINDAGTTF